jgi:hypothetical protein
MLSLSPDLSLQSWKTKQLRCSPSSLKKWKGKQLSTALDRFNTKVKTKSGTEELYAPSACRNNNPITGSRVVRGTDPFVKLVAEGEALQKKYQEEFRGLFKTAAALEVSL